jgi:tetratricopeptide (TPR) repeat protein
VLEPARVMRLVLEASDDPTTLRFGHVVVRDVIYQEMAARERARWHLRACTALRGLTASDPDRHLFTLADHAYRAALLDGGRLGFEYAMRAGRRARDQLAYEVAVQHFERAVRLVRPDHDRSGVAQCDAWTALGESQIRAGYRAGAVRSLERAGELARGAGLGEQLARVAMTVAPGMLAIEAGVYDPLLVRLLSEAAAEIGPDDPGRRARILARQALALYWSDQDAQRRRLVEEGTALADRCGDPVAAAEVRVLRIAAQWGPDNVAERERLLPGALAELEAAGSLEESIVIRMYWVTTLIELGRTASIEREIARYDREATLLRQPMTSWVALLFQAMRALDAGRLPEAEAHAEAFLRIGRQADDQNSELSFIAVTWLIRSLQGRFDAAVEINTRGLREYPHVRAMRFALPGTLASAGRRQEARVALDRVAARGFADEAHDVHYLADFSYLADACAELGDAKLGAMLREQLAPYGERTVVVGFGTATRGAVAYYVARLDALCGNVRRAREQFEAAIHRNRAAGAVPWLAATLLRYADFLDQRAIAAKDAMRHRAEGRRLVAEHSLAGLLAKQERAGTDRRHA